MTCEKRICRTLIACMLSFVVLLNCNTFRSNVYANPVAAAIAVEMTPEAVAALAGILAALGFEVAAPEDVKEIVHKFLVYSYQKTAEGLDKVTLSDEECLAMAKERLVELGLKVNLKNDNAVQTICLAVNTVNQAEVNTMVKLPVDHPENVSDWSIEEDIRFNNQWEIWRQSNPELPKLPKPEPPKDFSRAWLALLASSVGLTTFGSRFYNFLHNSEDVEFVPGSTATIGNHEAVKEYLYNFFISNCSAIDIRPALAQSKSFCTVDANYKFYDVFTSTIIPDKYEERPDMYGSYEYYVYVISYNDKSSACNLRFFGGSLFDRNARYNYSFGMMVTDHKSQADYSTAFNKMISDYRFADVSAPDMHFANSDVAAPEDVNTADTIKVGDTIYNITQGDNIYNNQQYVTKVLDGKTNNKGETLVAVPTVNPDSDVYEYPKPVIITDDGTLTYGNTHLNFVNPDDPDLLEDYNLSQYDYDNKNIFKLLYDFFRNFWAKLRQVFTDVLKTIFVPKLDNVKITFDLLKTKFPIVEQVDILFGKLFDYDYSSGEIPSFLIKYKSIVLSYESGYMPLVDFSVFDSFRKILHGIILFVSYFIFGKKVVSKLTKVFQP